MSDYIVRFEHLYSKMKNDITRPVLAYKLLERENLSQQERQLALTATNKLEYSGMKSALKCIFGEKFTSAASSSVVKVKEEPMFLTSISDHKRTYTLVKESSDQSRKGPIR